MVLQRCEQFLNWGGPPELAGFCRRNQALGWSDRPSQCAILVRLGPEAGGSKRVYLACGTHSFKFGAKMLFTRFKQTKTTTAKTAPGSKIVQPCPEGTKSCESV